MQRGVDIQQIRRVKKKYEREAKQGGLGVVSNETSGNTDSRLRTNNGKTRPDYKRSDYGREVDAKANGYSNMRMRAERDRTQEHPTMRTMRNSWTIRTNFSSWFPDTAQMLQQLLAERDALKRKCSDAISSITTNSLSEPNMNIATPQNYRLGPGDAVFIDI